MKKPKNNNNNLPKGWRKVKLGELVIPGGSVSGPFGSDIKSIYFRPKGVPIIRGNNLTMNTDKGRYIDDDYIFLDPKKFEELKKAEALPEDIIITARGTIGQTGIIPRNSKYPRYIISANQLRFRIDKQKADPLFVYYQLSSKYMAQKMQNYSVNVGVPNFNLTAARNLELLIPEDVNEQKRIADILSAFDDKIEVNNKIIKTLEEMAQKVFKEWILKNQKSKVKIQKLGDLADIKYGKGPATNKLKKSGYPVYGANGVIGYSDSYDFSERQIIIGCRGVVGNVTLTLPNCAVTHNSLIIMPKNNKKLFFYYLLKNQNLDVVVGGSAQPQITIKDLEQLELPIVDENLQNKFELMVGDIEQKKLLILFENQKLTAIRDLLLPKLMSGEIRV